MDCVQTISHYIKVAASGHEFNGENMSELEAAIERLIDVAVSRAIEATAARQS